MNILIHLFILILAISTLAIISLFATLATCHFTLESTDYVCACEDRHFDECSAGWAYGWPGRSFTGDPGANVDDCMTI